MSIVKIERSAKANTLLVTYSTGRVISLVASMVEARGDIHRTVAEYTDCKVEMSEKFIAQERAGADDWEVVFPVLQKRFAILVQKREAKTSGKLKVCFNERGTKVYDSREEAEQYFNRLVECHGSTYHYTIVQLPEEFTV